MGLRKKLRILLLVLYSLAGFLPPAIGEEKKEEVLGQVQLQEQKAQAEQEKAPEGKIYIKVGEANLKKSLLAFPPLHYLGSPVQGQSILLIGKELTDTVNFDLTVSNYFQFIPQSAFIEDTSKTSLLPLTVEKEGFDFQKWKPQETKFLIRAGYRLVGEELVLEAHLYDVPQAQSLLSKTYRGQVQDLRLLAHSFTNDVIYKLTGERGIFKTKIVFARNTNMQKLEKKIYIMDWDGKNLQPITKERGISTSPSWSPDGKTIAYTTFAWHENEKSRNMDVFTYDLVSKKRFAVAFHKGMNSGASFTPDGKFLLLTSSKDGTADIWRYTVDGDEKTNLTEGPRGAINVEPMMSPDGKKIAFSSDRGGRPMIYMMNSDRSNVAPVTNLKAERQYASTPRWSPDGKKIVFAGFDGSHFDVFIMDSSGSNMKRLTSAKRKNGTMANNEEPSFSPDGHLILFVSDRTGSRQLYLIDPEGENERRLTQDTLDYYKPQWSPYL